MDFFFLKRTYLFIRLKRNISFHLTNRAEIFDVSITQEMCYAHVHQSLTDDFSCKKKFSHVETLAQ